MEKIILTELDEIRDELKNQLYEDDINNLFHTPYNQDLNNNHKLKQQLQYEQLEEIIWS